MRTEDFWDYFKLKKLVREPWKTIRFREKKEKGDTLEVQFLDGRKLWLRAGFRDFHMFHRIFLRDVYRLKRAAPKQLECVLDLGGGNIGVFAVYASAIARSVYTFEPLPSNFELLQSNISSCSNVRGFCEAVSDRAGTLRLFHPRNPSHSGSYSTYNAIEDGDGTFDEVRAITLDRIMEREEIARCDLLKIDVEGREYDILHGCSDAVFKRIDRISGEYHNVSTDDPVTRIENFKEFLLGKGYDVNVLPHPQKENFGMFYAWKPDMG